MASPVSRPHTDQHRKITEDSSTPKANCIHEDEILHNGVQNGVRRAQDTYQRGTFQPENLPAGTVLVL